MARRNNSTQGRRSGFEDQVADKLGSEWKYEKVIISYRLIHTYTPDWSNGTDLIEAKGRWTSSDRTKIKTVLAQNPSYNLTMVFQNPNRTINKASTTTYADYCDKHGIKWTTLENLSK